MSISHHLRQLRIERKMTQEQVADQINVTRQTLSSYESGRTRPDLNMLLRLSEVYGTDLDGIIYGQSRVLKMMRWIQITAVVIFVLLTAFTVVSSALLWSANHFYKIAAGQLSPEEVIEFAARQRLIGAWEATDNVILTISFLGFALLFILLVTSKCTISLKVKVIYLAGLAAALLAAATLFGAADSVFALTNYVTTPILVIVRMILFLAADLIIELIKNRLIKHDNSLT